MLVLDLTFRRDSTHPPRILISFTSTLLSWPFVVAYVSALYTNAGLTTVFLLCVAIVLSNIIRHVCYYAVRHRHDQWGASAFIGQQVAVAKRPGRYPGRRQRLPQDLCHSARTWRRCSGKCISYKTSSNVGMSIRHIEHSGVARGWCGGCERTHPNFRSSVFPQNADKYRPTYPRIKTHLTDCSLPCCAK